MSTVSQLMSGTPQLDEHVDDLCFTLALALRRLLGLAVDSTADEVDEETEFEALLEEDRYE